MVTKWIKSRFSRTARPTTDTVSCDIAPTTRVTAVGDIHGRLDLLHALLPRLDDQSPLVFVGDYIDRGPYSAQVLHHLRHLSEASDRQVHCLLGNHEEMLLHFLGDPERHARLWFRNGGMHTLASFGLKPTGDPEDSRHVNELADDLRQAMGQDLLEWLTERPLIWTSGNVAFVHAALDPHNPVEAQDRQICLWGHPMFPRIARRDGLWVVHGHTIVDHPRVRNKVLSIDTGAFATGRLTAAEIEDGGIRFLSTA
ncbi:metallophosphoesterase family protein [Ruegeria sp. 6PALISEP08]|uniref:metallophosphoesterase family protein n=1 Tax=Ruegeria sp. 6PALISEP08 TaxID=1225660 RepID=UPI00067EA299|nr:metallophosphoesterase family protein [Ruegeria sp. 6PALISEP08]